MKLLCAVTVSIAALVLCSSPSSAEAVARGSDSTSQMAERLVPLASGHGRLVSYGLYCLTTETRAGSNAPPGRDLVLVLRNTGAKWIKLGRVSVSDFSLRDAQGKDIKLYLRGKPTGMGYGETEVIHLWADPPLDTAEPWSLRFEAYKAVLADPLILTVDDIRPSKGAQK